MLSSLFSFILLIVILVFVHEMGHFAFARLFGVKVDVFSIGFGKEICGYTDNHGTRWRLSYIPLGGYVKMFGDAGPSSTTPSKFIEKLSAAKKQQTLFYKSFWQKFLIILGGPLFNYIFACILLTGFYYSYGKVSIAPVIGKVVEGGAAAAAGLQQGDRIIALDDNQIDNFMQMRQYILMGAGQGMVVKYLRQNQVLTSTLTPQKIYDEEYKLHTPFIGIEAAGEYSHVQLSMLHAISESGYAVYRISSMTLQSLGQMLVGTRSASELRGSFTMANESKKSISRGWIDFLLLVATLSVNLGLINLMPIPVLDGGHLLIMTLKKITGGVFLQSIEKALYLIGGSIIIFLIVISTSNDIKSLFF